MLNLYFKAHKIKNLLHAFKLPQGIQKETEFESMSAVKDN